MRDDRWNESKKQGALTKIDECRHLAHKLMAYRKPKLPEDAQEITEYGHLFARLSDIKDIIGLSATERNDPED